MPLPADVHVVDDPEHDRYVVEVGGEPAGVALYRRTGDRITFVHTEVADGHEGEGLGSRLVRGALDDARRQDLEVAPSCPFVAAFIRRHPGEYLDLVAPALRAGVAGKDAAPG